MKHIEQHVWKNQETTFAMRFEEFLGKDSRELHKHVLQVQ
jgi:hypothetical protein